MKGHILRKVFQLALLLGSSLGMASAVLAQGNDIVWVWNSQCHKPTHIALRVLLDGKTIYFRSLPLCQWERRFEDGRASFSFTPKRTIVWYGYRSDEGEGKKDPGDPTAAGTSLEVDFWQAGGETDLIELGYDVAANDGLHMNSLHLLWPTKKSTTIMAPGLILETYPENDQ